MVVVDDNGDMVFGDVNDASKRRQTYFCAFSFVPAATPTDVLEIIGAANKVVEVVSIRISGASASTNGYRISLLRRSTLNTGGTPTSQTIVSAASTNTASGVTVRSYTANPSGLGTLVGGVTEEVLTLLSTTAATFRTPNDLLLSRTDASQGVILSSATDTLCVNLQGVATAPTRLDFSIIFREYIGA